jgi:hypothetical protein
MKKIVPLAVFIILGFLLTTGCVDRTKSPEGTQTTVTIPGQSSMEVLKGPLSISIGDYNAKLPVFIDNTSVGEVSQGKPFTINVNEGHHSVKVCDANICEQVDVEIKPVIKISIDFGERLIKDIPQGPLSVSIDGYTAKLPVYLDNTSVGEVSTALPLNISVKEGYHTVKVCSGNLCEQQGVEIKSGKQTVVDFGERLAKASPQGPLSISIGGYNAEHIPVLIDDNIVGEVSLGKLLNLMVSEGSHTVKICVGMVCETEDVNIKFAQPSFIDFGERLKKDVEFSKPTARITSSFLSGITFIVNTEFINPDTTDHTMTATVGCGYSYIDYNSKERKNEFAQTQVSQFVKAGDRQTQQVILYLSKGTYPIASEPTVVDMVTK